MSKNVAMQEYIFLWWAEYCILSRNYLDARKNIEKSINLALKSGVSTSIHLSLQARIEAALGNNNEALQYIQHALTDPRINDGMKADLYANAARTYITLGDTKEAQKYALAAYKYAWADGEPNIRFWPLDKSRKILDELGVAYPSLPPFVQSDIQKMPNEDEIRKKYVDNRDNIINSSVDIKNGIVFEVTSLSWVQIGAIAYFGVYKEGGVDDIEMIHNISRKISKISYIPTPMQFSRMGEEVPEPVEFEIDIEHDDFETIHFTFEELRNLNKTFVIMYIESQNSAGEHVYAFVNARGDRLAKLLDKDKANRLWNIQDFATVILTGTGKLKIEDRKRMQKDYLFGEHSMNVRIFPPLAEVNESKNETVNQVESSPHFMVLNLVNVTIGTIAFFGVNNEQIIR